MKFCDARHLCVGADASIGPQERCKSLRADASIRPYGLLGKVQNQRNTHNLRNGKAEVYLP